MEFNIETELTAIPNINALLSGQERQARLLLMDKIIMKENNRGQTTVYRRKPDLVAPKPPL